MFSNLLENSPKAQNCHGAIFQKFHYIARDANQ